MSVVAQAVHLVKFDLLRTRWWVAAYAVVLTASAFNASGLAWLTDALPYLVVLTGMIATLVVVQGDSPYRHDAFWRGRAVHPAALLLAKFVVVGALFVAMPVLVAVVVVGSFDLSASAVMRFVLPSVPIVAMWAAVAILIGACTQDVKSAFLLGVLSAVGFYLFLMVFSLLLPKVDLLPLAPVFRVIALVSIAAVVAITYLVGASRRTAIAATVLLTWAGTISLIRNENAAVAFPTATLRSESMDITDIALQGDGSKRAVPSVRIRLQRERPGVRYELNNALLTAHFINGDSLNVPLNGTLDNGSLEVLITLPTGMKWRTSPATTGAHQGTLTVPMFGSNRAVVLEQIGPNAERSGSAAMTPTDVRAAGERLLRDSLMRIEVHATVARYVLEEVGSVPYSTRAAVSKSGRRVTVRDSAEARRRGLVVEISTLGAISLSERMSFSELASWSYMVVLENAARGEARSLPQQTLRKLDGAFIIPGLSRSFEAILVTGAKSAEPALDLEWLSGATVRVVRWKREGVVQLDAERTLRP